MENLENEVLSRQAEGDKRYEELLLRFEAKQSCTLHDAKVEKLEKKIEELRKKCTEKDDKILKQNTLIADLKQEYNEQKLKNKFNEDVTILQQNYETNLDNIIRL